MKHQFEKTCLPKPVASISELPIQVITPHQESPRKHSERKIKRLMKNIEAFSFVMPLLVDKDNFLIAGHARLEAARRLGMTTVPVIRLEHLTPEQADALRIAENRLAEQAYWDEALLAKQLKALSILNLDFDIEATGFTVGEIDMKIEMLELGVSGAVSTGTDPADQWTLPAGTAVTAVGDVWHLGHHRLVCGNALDSGVYTILMTKGKATMIVTDPPYNVKINGHVGGKGAIKHREFAMAVGEMSEDEFIEFLHTVFLRSVEFSVDGSVHVVFMDWRHSFEILTAARRAYTSHLNTCVWAKPQAGMGSLYRSQHELAFIFKNGKAPHRNNVELGRFGRYRTNVWNYPSIHGMRNGEEGDLLAMHPTVKPVKMIADAILDCSKRGDLILDPFIGSGTALLACERVGRICRGIELDPLYVDTAIRRWQAMTGENAVLDSIGQTFTQREQAIHNAQEVSNG